MPRLRAMVDKVVSRHGARLPRLAQLQATFAELQHELLDHMKKEDVVLFPAIVALEDRSRAGPVRELDLDRSADRSDGSGACIRRRRPWRASPS